MFHYLWLIPLLPFAGFAFNGLFGARSGKKVVTVVGCATVLLSLLLSTAAVWQLATADLGALESAGEAATGLRVSAERGRVEQVVWEWVPEVATGGAAPALSPPMRVSKSRRLWSARCARASRLRALSRTRCGRSGRSPNAMFVGW